MYFKPIKTEITSIYKIKFCIFLIAYASMTEVIQNILVFCNKNKLYLIGSHSKQGRFVQYIACEESEELKIKHSTFQIWHCSGIVTFKISAVVLV